MPPVESEGQAAWRELERVLASPGFSRNERLSRFLRFVVERHLAGRDEELKESLIGIEVFGRAPGYDPKKDPIVRTEASRLRARLSEYSLGEGKAGPLPIELPRGGYVPVFRPLAEDRSETATPRVWNTRTLSIGLSALLVVAAAFGWWRLHRNEPIAIAVLPLDNLSHDPNNDYFSDGLTDELIRNLSLIDGLAPRSRTSSIAFKGKPRNIHEVGKELGADYILEGSVLRSGQQLRIDAQFRVHDDSPIWSGKFEGELTDVFAMQDKIAREIVNKLRLNLGVGRRRYDTSVEAYDAFLRAQTLMNAEGLGAYRRGVLLFEEAIAKDPTFAPAYAGEAGAYAAMSGTFPSVAEQEEILDKMRATAEKAIQLDPLSAEAHDARAVAYARDGKWRESEHSFRRALELNPNRSTTRSHFAMNLLIVLGRTDEAVREMRLAEKSDPPSPELQYFLGSCRLFAIAGIAAISGMRTLEPAIVKRPKNWPPGLRRTRSMRHWYSRGLVTGIALWKHSTEWRCWGRCAWGVPSPFRNLPSFETIRASGCSVRRLGCRIDRLRQSGLADLWAVV